MIDLTWCASAITNEITRATVSVSENASETSNMTQKYAEIYNILCFSLEPPQGVGIVGTVGIVGIEFCCPEPWPTTHSVLVDIWSYS